jgi:diaminopimelate epimerase
MKIPFKKYHGAGNDFILMDFRHFLPQYDIPSFARCLCDRRLGIGADGLVILCSSSLADYKMRIFNADGSEPSMCGNGIRCLFDFIQKRENRLSELKIETLHGILKCRRSGEEITVNLGVPRILHWPIELPQGLAFVINTGVPHAILFDDDVDHKNIAEEGAQIRFHPQFAPVGVNVNFVSVKSERQITLRTYERGVEGETLACGTGAAAAAYVAMKYRGLKAPISVLTRLSFEKEPMQYRQDLQFQFWKNNQGELEIEMLGSAKEVFEGVIHFTKL